MLCQIVIKCHAKTLVFLFIAQITVPILAERGGAGGSYYDDDQIHFSRPVTPNTADIQAPKHQPRLEIGNHDWIWPEYEIGVRKSNGFELEYDDDDDEKYTDMMKKLNYNVSTAITGFGLSLLREIKSIDNVVLSPLSIATTLAVIQQGAGNNTKKQISRILGIYPTKATRGFWAIYNDLKFKAWPSANILNVASAIFYHRSGTDQFNIDPMFKKKAKNCFKTSVIGTDFDHANAAAEVVNKWVQKKTNGFIQKLLTEDSISKNTGLVLANAVFFKGQWKIPFDPGMTDELDFHLANGQTKRTHFMHGIGKHRAGELSEQDGGATFFVKPFEGERFSFMGILPRPESNLDELLLRLTGTTLLEKLTEKPFRDTKITLPKFAIQKQFDLQNILKKLGVTEMFSERGDLSHIGTYHGASPVISTAVHNAAFIVDERGAIGVAATAFGATLLTVDDDTVYFWADRPFLAVLWDAKNRVPLFMARIEDPTVL